jgi:4-aminobutyrate aminotransferase
MMRRMRTWIAKYPIVGDVRGRGLMIGIEIVADQESRTPAGHERDAIIKGAFERGVLCLGAGPNTIRLSPPLIVTQEQAGTALDILEECIGQVSGGR